MSPLIHYARIRLLVVEHLVRGTEAGEAEGAHTVHRHRVVGGDGGQVRYADPLADGGAGTEVPAPVETGVSGGGAVLLDTTGEGTEVGHVDLVGAEGVLTTEVETPGLRGCAGGRVEAAAAAGQRVRTEVDLDGVARAVAVSVITGGEDGVGRAAVVGGGAGGGGTVEQVDKGVAVVVNTVVADLDRLTRGRRAMAGA